MFSTQIAITPTNEHSDSQSPCLELIVIPTIMNMIPLMSYHPSPIISDWDGGHVGCLMWTLSIMVVFSVLVLCFSHVMLMFYIFFFISLDNPCCFVENKRIKWFLCHLYSSICISLLLYVILCHVVYVILFILVVLFSLLGCLWYGSTDSFWSPCYWPKKTLLCISFVSFPPLCHSSTSFGEWWYYHTWHNITYYHLNLLTP